MAKREIVPVEIAHSLAAAHSRAIEWPPTTVYSGGGRQ
jgi:hypothetical protein